MERAADDRVVGQRHGVSRRSVLMTLAGTVVAPRLFGAEDIETLRMKTEEIEAFLRDGKVLSSKSLNVGVTGTQRLTLSSGDVVHDAHVQGIDESKPKFETMMGTELNFRDCYKFNIAAYRLDRMLGLNMTPPSIERRWGGKTSAFTWWISDAMMEGERKKKKLEPPDPDLFNRQMSVVRVFDQLLFNTDRNLQNLLITADWNLWMIDHTRSFRTRTDLAAPKNLTRCDRQLLAKMRELTKASLTAELGDYLRSNEIDGLLARRDKIVAFFDARIARVGEAGVLFDLPAREPVWPVPPPKMVAGRK
jgi:hypothetical protein